VSRFEFSAAAALAFVAAVFAALLLYPLRDAVPYVDDYVFIALGRHIDNPAWLLVQDSVGTYFFRPLVMLAWWITTALFAGHAPAHYAFNMALHAINGLLVFALARRLQVSALPAALAALVFIAHPTAFSAAAWLSDRFDLFATAFGLLALIAVERCLEAPRPWRLALAVLAALAALFSKETGFAIVAVAALLIAWRDPSHHRAGTPSRFVVLVAVAASIAFAAAVRALVLRDAAQTTLLQDGLAATIAGGAMKWLRELPGFLVARQGNLAAILVWAIALAALGLMALSPWARPALLRAGPARAAAIGIALMAAAAAAQAPVLNAVEIVPYQPYRFGFQTLAACRFYYVPLAGFALLLAALGEAVMRSVLPPAVKRGAVALALCALAALLASSRTIGREWAALTQASSGAYARAAVAALKLVRPAPACKIYLLDLPPGASRFRDVADTAVKSALAPGDPFMACFIQSESVPWYHLVERRGQSADAASPLENIVVNGKAYPPLPVGNLAYHYLRIPDRAEVLDDPRATFLAYENGRFVDVTQDVRSRRREVRFVDTRPAI
jgi:hypothetical protein